MHLRWARSAASTPSRWPPHSSQLNRRSKRRLCCAPHRSSAPRTRGMDGAAPMSDALSDAPLSLGPSSVKRCARPPQHAACQIACGTCRTDRDGSLWALQDFALVISGHFRVVACAAAAPPTAAPSAQPSAAPVDETSVARPSEPSVVAAAGGQAQLMGAGCRGTRTVTSGSGLVDDGFGGKYEPRVTCEWLLRPGERPSCRTCHGTSLNLPQWLGLVADGRTHR